MGIELKVGRYVVHVSEKDLVMDNHACIQIITQLVWKNRNKIPLKMSQKQFQELRKIGALVADNELDRQAEEQYRSQVQLYRFNIPAMEKAGFPVKETKC